MFELLNDITYEELNRRNSKLNKLIKKAQAQKQGFLKNTECFVYGFDLKKIYDDSYKKIGKSTNSITGIKETTITNLVPWFVNSELPVPVGCSSVLFNSLPPDDIKSLV